MKHGMEYGWVVLLSKVLLFYTTWPKRYNNLHVRHMCYGLKQDPSCLWLCNHIKSECDALVLLSSIHTVQTEYKRMSFS